MIGRPHHVSSRWGAVVLLLCLGIAAAALLLRVPSIAAPLGIDQGLWASAVRAMARGQALYQDVWEQRPPGIYFVYLAGFRLLGWSAATVAWLDILAATATTILLAAMAVRLSGRLAGALVAALFAALSMPAWLFGYGGLLERSVCETFIVVCIAIVSWCAVVLRERASIAIALVGGLAAGAAVVLKPNAAVYAPAILGWWLVSASRQPAAPGRRPLMAAAVAGCLLAPLATVWWLWHGGVLAEARYAIVDFNQAYLAQGFTWDAFVEGFAKAVWLRMKTDPLWLAGGVGSLLVGWELIRRRTLDPLAALALWWGGGAAVVILVNGARLYTTYFIQAYAPLALLGAWVLLQIAHESRVRRLLATGTLGLMLLLLVQRGYVAKVVGGARVDWAALQSGGATQAEYLERFGGYNNARGYSARAHEEVAEYLQARTRADDRVFLFTTNGAAVYFLADRLPAHRFLRVNFFVGTPVEHPAFTLEAVVADLRARRPVYLVFERLQSASAWARVIDALRERDVMVDLLSGYRLEATIEDFTLYRRID